MIIFPGTRPRRLVIALVAAVLAVLGATMLLAAGAEAQAQGARAATYIYLRGTDTLGTETLSIADSGAVGVLAMKGQPRIEWLQRRRGSALGGITLRVYGAGATTPMQVAAINMQGDSAIAEITAGGRNVTQRLASKAGALPLVNSSVLHMVLLAGLMQGQDKSQFDVFLSSGGQTLPITIAKAGDTLVATLATLQLRASSLNEQLPSVIVSSQGVRVVRAEGISPSAAGAMARYNYDAPAGAPYSAEQVRIPTGRGYELAGTLTRPMGVASAPVVVTISGSGPQERDSRVAMLPGYAIFREIADTLTRRGIAVLRYDDRAVGESGGMAGANSATTVDAANDVRSVVAWLRTQPGIDASRIALAGHSEGGMIAPMVAATDPSVKAIALLAGTAYDGRRVLTFQIGAQMPVPVGALATARDSVSRRVAAVIDSMAAASPWMQYFVSYDPLSAIRRVKQPVLILQGETDRQVTAEQADTLALALRAAGNRRVALRKFPATNHFMTADPSGGASAVTIHVRPTVLGALADWLVATLK